MITVTGMFVSVAWAATGDAVHAPSITDLLFPLVNFLIFACLVKRFGLPLLRKHLGQRRDSLIAAIGAARKARIDAEGTVRKYQESLTAVDEECERIRAGLRAEGERERARIVAKAEESAARLMADADFLVEQEVRMARQQIRAAMASQAKAAAMRVLRRHMDAADQDRMVQSFSQQIQESQEIRPRTGESSP